MEKQLKQYGFNDVRKDRVNARRPLWRLDELDFEVLSVPGYAAGERYGFENALTAYQSASTPRGGLEVEFIYVGEGSPAQPS